MGKYTEKNLIKYEEAIQLHFDATGMTAWLTLKNYGWVFGAQPFDAVKQVTVGVSAEQLTLGRDEASVAFIEGMGFRPEEFKPYHSGPISISAMLDAIDVIRFQVEILKVNDGTNKGWRPANQKGFRRSELNKEIVGVFIKLNPFFNGKIDVAEGETRFWAKTSASLFKLLHQRPGALAVELAIKEYNFEKTGFTAYFPQPRLILEEQRTALMGDGRGKTKRQDMRFIEPLPFPSHVPIPAKFIDDGFERSESGPFLYDEFIAMLDQDYQQRSIIGLKGDVEHFLWKKTAPKTAGYLHKHIQRISCYAFRGDTRDPASIKAATGMMPGFTRKDKKVAGSKEIADEIDAAVEKGRDDFIAVIKKHHILHLGVYTLLEDFKGYLSTTTSTAIAKCFANSWSEEVNVETYCYAVRCRGGFHLPTNVYGKKADFKKEEDAQHRFIHFAEQEVAMPGAIYWDNDVVGARVIRCNESGQFFFGPVFLKDQLKRDDNGAFCELFELLSGKSQGEGFEIDNSYEQPPFEVRSNANPALCDPISTAPMVTISPMSLNFSNQVVGTSGARQTVTVTNRSERDISFWSIEISGVHKGDFQLEDQSVWRSKHLPAGESRAIGINFTPTGIGKRTGELRLSNFPSVSLSGNGLKKLTISPMSLDFSDQAVGTSSTRQTVTVTNRSERDISFLSIEISGVHKGDFQLEDQSVWRSKHLPAGESRAIGIKFTPTGIGKRMGELRVSGFPNVSLSGTGSKQDV